MVHHEGWPLVKGSFPWKHWGRGFREGGPGTRMIALLWRDLVIMGGGGGGGWGGEAAFVSFLPSVFVSFLPDWHQDERKRNEDYYILCVKRRLFRKRGLCSQYCKWKQFGLLRLSCLASCMCKACLFSFALFTGEQILCKFSTHTHTHTHTCRHTYVRSFVRTHTHTHICIHTHAHTCMHTHTQTHLSRTLSVLADMLSEFLGVMVWCC